VIPLQRSWESVSSCCCRSKLWLWLTSWTNLRVERLNERRFRLPYRVGLRSALHQLCHVVDYRLRFLATCVAFDDKGMYVQYNMYPSRDSGGESEQRNHVRVKCFYPVRSMERMAGRQMALGLDADAESRRTNSSRVKNNSNKLKESKYISPSNRSTLHLPPCR